MKDIGLPGQNSRIISIAMSSDKQDVVGGLLGSTIRTWNVSTGRQVGDDLYGHEHRVTVIAISHDCRWFASASLDKTLRLWELSSGKVIGQPLVGHTCDVWNVTISSDDRFVISASNDDTVRVWDMRSGKTIGSSLKHDWPVMSVYMSRDSQQIISVDSHDKVYLWKVSTGVLLKSAIDGPDCAYLAWKGRNEWNGEEGAGVESNKEKPRITVVGQDVYLCSPMENGNSFKKVGQFDDKVKDWDVDANGMLWVCFWKKDLSRLRVVTENSGAL